MRPVLTFLAFLPLACTTNVEHVTPAADAGPPDLLPPAVCKTPAPSDGPWLTEITSEVGLAKTSTLEPLGVAIVSADVDGDGFQDFWSSSTSLPAQGTRTQFLFMNRPDPNDPKKRVFVDGTDASGLLARRDGTTGRQISNIVFGDLDNDGDLDAVGCAGDIDVRVTDSCAAFLNDGKGHFKLAPAGGDLEKDVISSGSAALLDFDGDGVLDYWPATIGRWQYAQPNDPIKVSRPRLYKGNGDGTFTEVGRSVGLPSTLTATGDYRMVFGVTSCDIDLDGDRDVILSEYGAPIGQNHVWRNDNGTFVDVGKQLGVWKGTGATIDKGGGFTFAIACGDIDDDGDVDLFTAELHHAWYPDLDWSELLRNDTPAGQPLAPYVRPGRAAMGFEKPHIGGAWTEGDSQPHLVDLDLDGRKDVYLVSVNYPQQNAGDPDWTHDWLYRQKDDGTFEDITDKKTPWWNKDQQSLGNAAVFDIDNDGDLDIVTGTATYNAEYLGLHNSLHAYRNEVGQSQNLVRVRVRGGKGSNASGIGARVEVKAGGRTQQQEVLGAWAGTQNDVMLTFGLGSACAIDEIVVHWPDGMNTQTSYKSVRANYLVDIQEGESKVAYRALDGSTLKTK